MQEKVKEKKIIEDVILKVNGKKISMKLFVRNVLKSTVTGLVSTLQGCEKAKVIELKIQN